MQKKIEEFYMIKVENSNNKKNNKGLVIFLIVLVIVIALSTVLGIRCAIKANESNNVTDINEPNKETEETKEMKNKIPIYTELGRENMKNVYTSTKENKRVFLTFDDGPSSNITPLILDLLKENNIKATFFTLGSRVNQNPEIVSRRTLYCKSWVFSCVFKYI